MKRNLEQAEQRHIEASMIFAEAVKKLFLTLPKMEQEGKSAEAQMERVWQILRETQELIRKLQS